MECPYAKVVMYYDPFTDDFDLYCELLEKYPKNNECYGKGKGERNGKS